LTATLSNDSSNQGVTWTIVSGGGALSNETTTTAVYTAPATPTTALTVTIKATSVADTSISQTFTITVPAALTITTTGAQLDGTAGAAFSQQLASTTGEGTLTWSVDSSSSLPANWHLSASGLLTGPASQANYQFTFKCDLTDSGTPTPMTASVNLTVTIKPVAITFTATPTATATVGTQYTSAATATGGVGTLSYGLDGTTLPAGLTLTQTGTGAGTIAGNPTTSQKGGLLTSFTVQATDAWGDSATQSDGITVSYPALALSNPGSLTAYNGTTYTTTPLATLTPSGGSLSYTSITWAPNTAGGTIDPPGLSLNSATGAITGTPTTNGTYNMTATVTDSATETASVNFTVTVDAGITITPAPGALPVAYTNSPYSSGTLQASGGSGSGYKWSISSGSLPSWLSFSATSGASTTLTGTPTSTASAVPFTVQVKDSAGNVQTAAYSVTVDQGVSVTVPGTIPTFYPGDTTYAATTFTASGGAGGPYTYTWAATGGTALPSGLSITQSGANAGLITGTPVNATDASVVSQVIVTAKDSAGNTGASTTVSITIQGKITITTATPLLTGLVNTAYNVQLAASGGSNSFTWSTDGAGTTSLTGVGLTLNSNGTVTGTVGSVKAGSATFTATATDTSNSNHTGSLSMSVTINASLGITTNTITPTYAYGGTTYTSSSIAASGGTGTYTWSVASSSPTSLGTLQGYGLNLSSTSGTSITITGPVSASAVTSTTTLDIVLQVKDTNNTTATSATFALTLYPQFTLTPSLTSVAESATITAGQETVTATGGSGSYNFTTVTPPTGMSDSISGSVVSITGTAPATSGSFPFTVIVKDTTTGASIGSTNDYSLVVNAPGATIGGNITVTNGCGSTPTIPDATVVKLFTNPGNVLYATTTTTNGNYTFTGVAAGNYTIKPSYTGTGITSEFYPTSMNVTASGNTLTSENFSATIGYTVSGTVNYAGGVAGQIYLNLTSGGCGNNGAVGGTSLHTTGTTSGGSFTIQGVPPGTYTLKTFEDPDTLGQGQPNANDPVASNQGVTVGLAPASVSNAVNVSNPTYGTPTANPQFTVTQVPNGVLLFYQASTNSSKIEDADTYMIQWSTSSTLGGGTGGDQFLNIAGSHTFKAIGPKSSTVWILTNAILTGSNKFQVNQAYYFQARSFNSANGNSHPSGWFTTSAATTIVSTATPCSSCTAVTTSITIPSGITINTGAPLYEGFFQQLGNGAPTIYATVSTSPTTGSNSYTVSVPNGDGWTPFAILDQNLDGLIDAGNPNDTNNNSNGYTITSSTTSVPGGTLASTGATATIGTYYYSSVYNGGSSTGYNLNINVEEANQLPVAVELESGPNIMYPIDLSDYCPDCGHLQWQTGVQLEGVIPSVGDTYTFHVWYLNVANPVTITGQVTGWNNGSTLTGAGALATNLSPAVTATTTPGFSWSIPSADSTDSFQFWLNDNSVGQIWAIPSSNSNANGFASSITSLAWDVDPTDSTNKSTESTLNASHTYSWSIEAQDNYNNQAQASTWFIP
jgi:hypothetical protein